MRPFDQMPAAQAERINYVLHDIDDTITDGGKLLPEAYEALWRLQAAGLKVVPVTGRPAGWCDMILRQWPVDAVVGENGAFVYYMEDAQVRVFESPAVEAGVEEKKARLIAACLKAVPGCRVAKDQFCRKYDVAIDFCEDPPRLPLSEARRIQAVCEGLGARAKISSIHVNAWFGDYDKLTTARQFFSGVWGLDDLLEGGIFFGDSPNDEPMFERFSLSCAVANIAPFAPMMDFLPTYVTDLPGGRGFAQAVGHLIALRAGCAARSFTFSWELEGAKPSK